MEKTSLFKTIRKIVAITILMLLPTKGFCVDLSGTIVGDVVLGSGTHNLTGNITLGQIIPVPLAGTITLNSGAILNSNGYNIYYYYNGAITVNSGGTFNFYGGNLQASGTTPVLLTINGGFMATGNSASILISSVSAGSTLTVNNSGTVQVSGNTSLTIGLASSGQTASATVNNDSTLESIGGYISIDTGSSLNVYDGYLRTYLSGNFYNYGTTQVSSPAFFGSAGPTSRNYSTGSLTVNGEFQLQGGTFYNDATFTSNADFKLVGGTFRNGESSAGTLLCGSGGGHVQFLGGSLINGAATTGNVSMGSGTLTINSGNFTKGASTSNVTFYGANLNGISTIISGGTLTIPSGQTMTVPSGKTFSIGGSAATLIGGQISNPGTISLDGTITVSDTGTLANTNIITNGGTIANYNTITNSGTITNNDEIANIDTITNSGTLTNASTLNNFGTINTSVTLNNNGPLNNTGSVTNSGTLTNNNTITNTSTITNNGTLTNASTIVNNGTIDNTVTFNNNGPLNNNSTVTNSGTITNNDTIANSDTITNNGTLTNASTLTNDGTITNNDTLNNNNTLNNNGLIFDHDTFTNGGTLNNNELVTIESSALLTNNVTFNNNALFIKYNSGTFVNNGTFNDVGTTWDLATATLEVDPYRTTIIPSGFTFSIDEDKNLIINGRLLNLSNSTLNIYGNTYTYSVIDNGGASAGTINISYPGNLYLLGGTLNNDHAESVVNVKSGGSLYNYFGNIDLTTGGADSLDVKAGGKFHNTRGTNPGTFTPNAGCEFLDTIEMNLDSDLDIEYTWTITGQATINGYGNKITFGTNGEIVIEGDGASLLLKDIILEDISGNKIQCTENNVTLSIHNVMWLQDANFSFTKGKFHASGDWHIIGKDTKFSYLTDQISTIDSDAHVQFVSTTLEYDSSSPSRLILTDDSAMLHIDRGTLLATQDCTLSSGTLITTGNVTLQGTGILDLTGLSRIATNGATTHIGNVLT